MTMSPLRLLLAGLVALSCIAIAPPVADAQPAPVRVRGTIESINGDLLIVKGRDGRNVTMRMATNVAVAGVEKISLSDIKPGAYIGVTTVADAQGNQKATEVHLFPEALRGAGEGTQAWDTAPGSSMTNGGLDKIVEGNDGHMLTVKYRSGEKQVTVGPETEVVRLVPGKRSDLQSGAKIVAAASRNADGVLETSRISVGLGGLTPPM
ncbi:putative lipoprotein [Afipia carboxidovorans OM5]|nr:putative lipoprotein [Afipia carboxidovorans OM5]